MKCSFVQNFLTPSFPCSPVREEKCRGGYNNHLTHLHNENNRSGQETLLPDCLVSFQPLSKYLETKWKLFASNVCTQLGSNVCKQFALMDWLLGDSEVTKKKKKNLVWQRVRTTIKTVSGRSSGTLETQVPPPLKYIFILTMSNQPITTFWHLTCWLSVKATSHACLVYT